MNRVCIRAQSGLWIRFPIVNSHLDPDRLKWPIKKKKNEEIHVVTCRMFSYKGWRLLHGGQRIDFLSRKTWIWIRIHLKARIRIQWIWIGNSGISPVYFYHHICGKTALWFMFKILVLSLSYKIFPILRFLHQQDFIAFNIAQVVTFCSKKAAWKVISN